MRLVLCGNSTIRLGYSAVWENAIEEVLEWVMWVAIFALRNLLILGLGFLAITLGWYIVLRRQRSDKSIRWWVLLLLPASVALFLLIAVRIQGEAEWRRLSGFVSETLEDMHLRGESPRLARSRGPRPTLARSRVQFSRRYGRRCEVGVRGPSGRPRLG